MSVFKFLGSTVTLSNSAASNVSSSKLVQFTNIATGSVAHLITQKYANGAVKATFTVVGNGQLTVEKAIDDTFTVDSGSDVVVVPVAYRN